VLPYNDLEAVRRFMAKRARSIAGVILEPVAGNMGVVPPAPGFLEGLRELCTRHGALLIFDEVITGFRLCYGGAQSISGVTPDLTVLGKIIGGGLPAAAYGGRREVMACVSPEGPVYQAGTLSGNPLAVAAGIAQLTVLRDNPSIYANLEDLAARLEEGFRGVTVNRAGSMMTPFFTSGPVTDWASAAKADVAKFGRFHRHMRAHGIALAPSQFEAWFVSYAHTRGDIDRTVKAVRSFKG
jgi:glutamate-1-semialdehyde 2,1-aminomutase